MVDAPQEIIRGAPRAAPIGPGGPMGAYASLLLDRHGSRWRRSATSSPFLTCSNSSRTRYPGPYQGLATRRTHYLVACATSRSPLTASVCAYPRRHTERTQRAVDGTGPSARASDGSRSARLRALRDPRCLLGQALLALAAQRGLRPSASRLEQRS